MKARGVKPAEPPGPPVQLLTVKEVAALLRVPVQTLYDWRVRGLGPVAIRVGRHLRFDPADVSQWVAERRAESDRRPWWAQR